MVTLVTFGVRTSNFVLLDPSIDYVLMYFLGFFNQRLIFFDFFCNDLLICACVNGGEMVKICEFIVIT